VKYFEPYTEFRTYVSRIPLKAPGGEKIFIEIEPGSSFGSGHETTRLCIKGIEEIFKLRKIKTALDLGCGSGILGISVAMLGAEGVLGIDIDPIAVEEARKNTERNGVSSKVRIFYGPLDDIQGRFDLIVTNIVTDELLRMKEEIKSVMEKDAILLISGVSELKKDVAISGFKEVGLSLNREFADSGWVAIWFSSESKI
jgi:ribosomal protein L11 methyltransferase